MSSLPPYAQITPDAALAGLEAPTDTAGFAQIARACEAGRDDLAGRGLDERGQKRLRRFSTWEITKYLIPVAPAHFRRVLRANPGKKGLITGNGWYITKHSIGIYSTEENQHAWARENPAAIQIAHLG